MSKALITGITSFHGEHIANELMKEGYEVHGLLRHVANRNYTHEGVTMHKGDVRDWDSMYDLITSVQPEVIVHLAAQSPVEYSFTHENEVMDTNYGGTFNVANVAYRFLPNLQKFMLASSVETYGNQPKMPLREEMAPNPASPYGVAKVAAETYVRYLARGYGFPGIILRTSNTYGRDKNDYFIVERIISQMAQGVKYIHLGGHYPVRDFLYVDDEVRAYMGLILSDNPYLIGETFNTGTKRSTSIGELFYMIQGLMNSDAEPVWNTNSPRPYEILDLTTDYRKIKRAIGWEPELDLETGLRATIGKWVR